MKSNKKVLIISALVLILALVVSSCGAITTVKNELGLNDKAGVTYNKLTISENDIDADLKAIADNKPLKELLADTDSVEPLVIDGKVTPTYRASWANIKMRTLSFREVRLKHKQKITKKDIETALQDAKDLFGGADENDGNLTFTDKITKDEIWDAFPTSFQDRLVESFAERYALLRAAPKVTDAEIKEFFDKNQETLAAPCESGKTISHILVEEEAKAKEIEKKIAEGEDFAKLAKDNSTDPGSKDSGGSLGCFTPGNFVEEFENAAIALEPGSVSGIIKTDFGYHILKATTYVPSTLEESKESIKAQLEPEKQQKLFDEIQKSLEKAKVKVSSKYGQVTYETDKNTGEKSKIPSIVPLKKDTPTTTSTPAPSAPEVPTS